MSSDECIQPWGRYDVLVEEIDYKTKVIVVEPGKGLSLQSHSRRAEHWFVVRGEGVVVLDGLSVPVKPGMAVDIPVGCVHRLENTGAIPLAFVEVQHGEYFGEDDVIRIEDPGGQHVRPDDGHS